MTKTVKLAAKKRARKSQRRTDNGAASRKTAAARPRQPTGRKKVTRALLQEMTRRLVDEFQPEQVILFGSYAWGKPTRDSDVDLLVIVSDSDETEYQRMVRGLMCLRGMGVSKDVLVKTRAEFDYFAPVIASLEAAILRKGKVLYERGKTIARPRLVNKSTA